MYSAASKMKQIDEVEKHLRVLQKELIKPKVIDFLETSMVSSAEKAKLFKDVGEKSGNCV